MNYFKPIASPEMIEWFSDCANKAILANKNDRYVTDAKNLTKDFKNLELSLIGTKAPSYLDPFLICDSWSAEDASMILSGLLPYEVIFDLGVSALGTAQERLLEKNVVTKNITQCIQSEALNDHTRTHIQTGLMAWAILILRNL
jgi:hypothetical protein